MLVLLMGNAHNRVLNQREAPVQIDLSSGGI